MGFANTLKRNAVNEWKDYYVDYENLRTRIRTKDFKSMLYSEVNKVNSFYFLLEKKAMNEKTHLFSGILPEAQVNDITEVKTQESGKESGKEETKTEGESIGKSTNESGNEAPVIAEDILSKFIPLKKGYTKRKKEKFITEFLHSLVKIKAYRDLNVSGLLKLAKKYAVVFKNDVFYEKFDQKLKETYFYKSKRVDSIRILVKKTYKTTFAKDQPEKAKTVFKRLGSGSKSLDIYYIFSGFLTGISFTLVCLFSKMYEDPVSFKFICGINGFYLGCFLFGLCMKIFKFYLINYKFIFNFDFVSSMNNSIYLLFVSSLSLIANLMFLFRSKMQTIQITSFIPLVPFMFVFNPFDILCLNSRIYLVTSLSRGLFLPVSTIRFRHFYFIDILQSFKFPIETLVLYYCSNNVNSTLYAKYLYLLLPTLRILQCLKRFAISKLMFPHIANAGKYLLSFMVLALEIFNYHSNYNDDQSRDIGGIMNNIHYVILALKFMSSVASFSWDVLIDWVIFRNRYMFPIPFYLFAIICNFCIRFFWIIPALSSTLSLNPEYQLKGNIILESMAEIVRRFIWTLIRVEVEHLNNCDELKAKKAINLTNGEFFYKKDTIIKNEPAVPETEPETEFETEMESDKETENRPKSTEETHAGEEDTAEEHEEDSTESTRETSESDYIENSG